MSKRILITADATRNKLKMVGEMVQKLCAERGLPIEFVGQFLSEVDESKLDVQLIVLFGTSKKLHTPIPIVSGVPFLTRIGMDKAADEIVAKLKG